MAKNNSSKVVEFPGAGAAVVAEAEQVVAGAGSTPLDRFQAVEAEINSVLLEREELVRLAFLCMVAERNMVLLGPPGTGKSALVGSIADRVREMNGQGLTYFELLFTKFTTPEEVFGPLSVPDLQQKKYIRATQRRLPEAQIAFLDEVFKANSAIMNALLTLLNEKEFDNDGRIKTPLITTFGASNEMPGPDMSAFWDRWHCRAMVKPLSDAAWERMMNDEDEIPAPSAFLSVSDLEMLQVAARQVVIPDSVKAVRSRIRKDLEAEGIKASDRRWKQSNSLVRANAALEGRDIAEPEDLMVLKYMLWDTPEQIGKVEKAIGAVASPVQAKAAELFEAAVTAFETCKASFAAAADNDTRSKVVGECSQKLNRALREMFDLVAAYRDFWQKQPKGQELKNTIMLLHSQVDNGQRQPTKLEKQILKVESMKLEIQQMFMGL